MPSGKRSKQQRRQAAVKTPPPVRAKGGPRRPRQASPRALAIGGGAVALIVIAVVLAVVLAGGGSGSGIPKGTPTIGSVADGLPGSAEAVALYKGIPQKGLYAGSAFAPVQMVMYIDLQCPICQNFELTAMPTLLRKYVRTGKLRIHVMPWAFIGPDSYRGQDAMLAAAKQDKAFVFSEVLYLNQGTENTGWLTDSMLAQIAASVPGLDVPKLFADRKSSTVKSEAAGVAASAEANKVDGTPTIFVGKNGTKPKNVAPAGAAPTLQQVESAVQAALS
jgi:protein-disulfide isomerase